MRRLKHFRCKSLHHHHIKIVELMPLCLRKMWVFYVEVSLLQLDGHVFLDTELLVPYIG